jgi:hypothetical protein
LLFTTAKSGFYPFDHHMVSEVGFELRPTIEFLKKVYFFKSLVIAREKERKKAF